MTDFGYSDGEDTRCVIARLIVVEAMIHTVIGISIAMFAALAFGCGFMASRYVDDAKIGSIPKNSIMLFGPMVPESVLCEVGKKWAFRRNVCVALFCGVALVYAIVMRISEIG